MSGAGHVDPSNKQAALVISLLALLLAIAEILGNSAQVQALGKNVEASNLWSFFQAKTIRMTTLRSAADAIEAGSAINEKQVALVKKWREDIKRYDHEPEPGEGRTERAKAAEALRDRALSAHHLFELSSAIIQIGIVLTSASIIVAMPLLVWVGVAAGAVGVSLGLMGFFAPTFLHIF